MQASATKITQKTADARAAFAGFAKYPDALKDPKWPVVAAVIDKADASGKSWAYVEERREDERARSFFASEQKDISGRVAGAVQYADKGCKTDSGVVGGALKEAVSKSVEKRLRRSNEAHSIIERQRTSLGKENAATLEKQADEIAETSHAVHVDLVEERERLTRLLGDGDTVRRTMDSFLAAEGAYQAEAGRTDADKKASNERVQAMNKAKSELDQAVSQGKAVAQRADADLQQLTKDYDAALAALRQNIAARPQK